MKLPAAAYSDVIGIAVSMASGVNANYGTMTKPLHAGHAARNGMAAALLGKAGLSANATALEGRGGFFATFARGIPWSAEPFDDLGRTYDLAEVGFRPKRYPCGGVIHTGIDAALQIRDELGATRCRHHRDQGRHLEIRREPRRHGISGQHGGGEVQSAICHRGVAGERRAEARTRSSRRRSRTRASRRWPAMVSVAIDPEFADAIEDYPTRVAVTLKDGRTVERLVVYASGTAKNPMSPAQMREKFFDCSAHAGVARPVAEKIAATLDRLGEQPSFQRILAAYSARLTFILRQG